MYVLIKYNFNYIYHLDILIIISDNYKLSEIFTIIA